MTQRTKILLALSGLAVLLAVILLARAFTQSADGAIGTPYAYQPDAQRLAQLMSQAVTYKTIAYPDERRMDGKTFLAFHRFLEQRFPLTHRKLKRETISRYSLLYHWKGTGGGKDKPVILIGHLDVVPISPGTEDQWTHPAFKGVIDDEFIWGRGTLDDKINVIGILAAIEDMLKAGLAPKRDIYIAFGHDEEIGGARGAKQISRILEQRGVRCEFLLDEGGSIRNEIFPGFKTPVAIVAPAEKGIVTLKLTAKGAGGHSAAPPPQSSIGILAAAITKLEANPFPKDSSHMRQFLRALSDHMPWTQRFFINNMFLFEPIVMSRFDDVPAVQAMMRTTTAATIIDGGVKFNVLPIEAVGIVNFRILPGETLAGVKARVIEIIDDERIEVSYEGVMSEPSPVAATEGFSWEQLTGAIRDSLAPEAIIIAPRLLIAATDTRHYRNLCANHYRYNGLRFSPGEIGMIHGTNERIRISNLKNATRFYHRLMSGL